MRFNVQTIYNILGIIAFVVSAAIATYTYIKSLEHYEVHIIDYELRRTSLQLFIMVVNKSTNPLVIRSISCGGIDCELEPKLIRGGEKSLFRAITPLFPLGLEALGCQQAYLEFVGYPHNPPTPGTTLTLQICSTRKSEQKTVLLGEQSHYLHTRG